MRILIPIILVLLIGCDNFEPQPALIPPASQPAAAVDQTPVVLIDASHAMHENRGSAKPYLFPATGSIALDASKFNIRDPKNLGRMPNTVQVLYDRSEYKLAWPLSGRAAVMLDQATMQVLKGNPFDGFGAGKQAIVAVGYREESKAQPGSDSVFDPFWVGQIIFK